MTEHTIYTTMEPDRERVVGDAEYTDLKRRGLIAMEKSPSKEPEQSTQTTQTQSGKAKDKSKDEE